MDNKLISIDKVWMAVAVDPEDNTEGVCAVFMGGMWMPLLAADEERLPFIMQEAEQIAKSQKKLVKIIRLHNREEVTEINGRDT